MAKTKPTSVPKARGSIRKVSAIRQSGDKAHNSGRHSGPAAWLMVKLGSKQVPDHREDQPADHLRALLGQVSRVPHERRGLAVNQADCAATFTVAEERQYSDEWNSGVLNGFCHQVIHLGQRLRLF